MSMINSKGFMKLLFTCVNNVESAKAAQNAVMAIRPINNQFTGTRRTYWAVAILVPLNDGIFKVPNTVARGYCGSSVPTVTNRIRTARDRSWMILAVRWSTC